MTYIRGAMVEKDDQCKLAGLVRDDAVDDRKGGFKLRTGKHHVDVVVVTSVRSGVRIEDGLDDDTIELSRTLHTVEEIVVRSGRDVHDLATGEDHAEARDGINHETVQTSETTDTTSNSGTGRSDAGRYTDGFKTVSHVLGTGKEGTHEVLRLRSTKQELGFHSEFLLPRA
jgi:hypothetical protein